MTSILQAALLLVVVIFKICWATNAMLGPEGSPKRYWPNPSDGVKSVAELVDRMFLLLAAVLPTFETMAFLFFYFPKLHVVRLQVSLPVDETSGSFNLLSKDNRDLL